MVARPASDLQPVIVGDFSGVQAVVLKDFDPATCFAYGRDGLHLWDASSKLGFSTSVDSTLWILDVGPAPVIVAVEWASDEPDPATVDEVDRLVASLSFTPTAG